MHIEDQEKGPLTFHHKLEKRIWQALLPFQWYGRGFIARPQRPFKPKGLVIWDAPKGAEFYQGVINNELQLLVGIGGIPARFFAYGDSYEQIAAKLDAGLAPPAWGTWCTIDVGQEVRIEIGLPGAERCLGPDDGVSIAMWGLSVR
jgi:hypothetical protein